MGNALNGLSSNLVAKHLLVLLVITRLCAQTAEQLEPHGVSIADVKYQGKSAVRLDALPDVGNGESYAIVKGSHFHNGTIEVELAGKPLPASFELEPKGAASDPRFVGVKGWMISKMSLNPGEEKTMTISYHGDYPFSDVSVSDDGTLSAKDFKYRLSTGGCWNGPIVHGTVVVKADGLNPDEINFILKSSGAKLLATGPDFVEPAKAASARDCAVEKMIWLPGEDPATAPAGVTTFDDLLSPDGSFLEASVDSRDLAQIVYTSGTESLPKGAMLTHEAVMWQYVIFNFALSIWA